MAQGAGQAIAENKASDKIMLIGFDSDDKTVKLLADGNIKALVVQDPFRMGYEGIKTALAASKGEKVPETVDTGVNLITKENMNSERSKESVPARRPRTRLATRLEFFVAGRFGDPHRPKQFQLQPTRAGRWYAGPDTGARSSAAGIQLPRSAA
jgi:hypothetical protein